ncbi:MAG: TolB family protein, partial [Halanaerobiaceae bacterium]
GDQNRQISQLAAGPGASILMSICQEGKRDIYQYFPGDDEPQPLIVDDYINIFPELAPEGNYIVFSSDRSGSFNLYAYDLEQEKLYQLTDLFTGAFEARFKNKEELIFVGYSKHGFDLYTLDVNRESWQPVEEFKNRGVEDFEDRELASPQQPDKTTAEAPPETDKAVTTETANKTDTDYEKRNYNPLNTLLPRYYIPRLSAAWGQDYSRIVAGISTGGVDALENHRYQLDFIYDSSLPLPQLELNYSYSSDNPAFDMQINIINDYRRRYYGLLNRRNYSMNFIFPLFKSTFSASDLLLGADYSEYSIDEELYENRLMLKAVFHNSVVRGWDQYTNKFNINIGLKYSPDLFSEDSGSNMAVELQGNNRFTHKNQSSLNKKFFLGYSGIEDYNVDNLNYIRALDSELEGDKLAAFNFEYGFRLGDIKSGRGHLPIFYDSINLYPYWDIAFAGNNNDINEDSVYGVEIGLKTSQWYGRQTVEYRLGRNNRGEMYFKIGSSF